MTSPKLAPVFLSILALIPACSSDSGTGESTIKPPVVGDIVALMPSGAESGAASPDDSNAPLVPGPQAAVITPSGDLDTGGIVDMAGDTAMEQMPMACESNSTPTSIQGVVLAFDFDVSASMGLKSDTQPYNDKTLKWDPVVAATKAFFSDPGSMGVSATLTFFPDESAQTAGEAGFAQAPAAAATPAAAPAASTPTMPAPAAGGGGFGGGGFGGGGFGGGGAMCDAASYNTTDVPLTELPSDVFGKAIDAITPVDDTGWRMGTPTLAALSGTIEAVQAMKAADTENKNKYVIVMVTDGEPAFCDNNDINAVAQAAAAVAKDIPVYVIGVANPVTPEEPNPPDSVSALNAIAVGGGTDQAFIINTDNPAETTAGFLGVIQKIRESSFSCTLPIPEPPDGQTFDKDKVNVTYTNQFDKNMDGTISADEMGTTEFVYDESCTQDFAWHYDDATNPTVIQMCGTVCDQIKADYKNEGKVDIEFGCKHRLAVQK
ncbi:MAG TPA: vWA domain-containing protein [Polyangiaceae bacterium]|jgi:hypothetical protein|nr:vWA domain-containing protein [Polyangiaceae bacterium]